MVSKGNSCYLIEAPGFRSKLARPFSSSPKEQSTAGDFASCSYGLVCVCVMFCYTYFSVEGALFRPARRKMENQTENKNNIFFFKKKKKKKKKNEGGANHFDKLSILSCAFFAWNKHENIFMSIVIAFLQNQRETTHVFIPAKVFPQKPTREIYKLKSMILIKLS